MKLLSEDNLTCKDVESLMQPFLENKLKPRETRLLLNHVENCKECEDELEIRFLLAEGLRRIEDGESLDLNQELSDRIKKSRKRLHYQDQIRAAIYLLEGGVALFLLANLIFFFV
ncbi:MAG: zf-HC2 domain-containing protein [Lachnospiraceae bacterium]|nr:zf-HC2 domain-containing protein [Lachnospiraceae bacterium]